VRASSRPNSAPRNRVAPDPVCEHATGMPILLEPLADRHHDEVYAICRSAFETDLPDIPYVTRAAFAAMLERPWPDYGYQWWVALLDGVPAGFLQLRLPLAANLGNVELDLLAAPQYRRRGLGRAMWAHAVDGARALGRKHLIASTTDQRPDGGAFAVAMGATAALTDTRSRLDVPPGDQARLDALLADARRHAGGYRIVRWTGVPPEEHLADVAYLESRIYAESPTGDLSIEAGNPDPERYRATEENRIALGRTAFSVGAVHAASGRMIAWTMINGNDDTPTQAWQQGTIVHPEHRGHRLGLLIKLENLRHVRERRPELTAIDTFNASANRHMLAVNEAMGFRRVDVWTQWQVTL
jgi:GNAT superfamily N-acetyltransferase